MDNTEPAATPALDDKLLYYCPTAEEVESAIHGGFDQCCGKPELHVPLPDSLGTQALSELLSQRQRDICAAQSQTAPDDGLREQYAAAINEASPDTMCDEDALAVADAALAVRDRHMEQMAAQIAELEKRSAEDAEDYAELANHNEATCEAVQRRDAAEAVLGRVREYLETSDDDGIRTRETVLRFLDAAEQAAREAS